MQRQPTDHLRAFHHRWTPGTNGRTLLLLHGTGGNEDDLLPLGQTLDPESNYLSPRGRVDEHGANRFFRRLTEGVFDLENMRQETEALAAFVRAASVEYGFDLEGLYAVGFSNGANIASSLIFRYPELARGAFLMRAMVPFVPSEPPALAGIRVLIASGETDPMVSRAQAEALATIYVQGGADVEHLWVPVGHNLTRQELERAKVWIGL